MQYSQYREKFIKASQEQQINETFIEKCLIYAESLFRKKLPVVYNIKHLAKIVGYSEKYINRSVNIQRQFYMYRRFKIPKKNGGFRTISEPLPSLKEIQYWILHNILEKNKISKYAKSYRSGSSIKQHVKYHKGAKLVVTLDIKDFFGSIKTHHITRIFLDMGYSKTISMIFAKLCTLKGELAQGAPTSPYLSNIYLKGFDETLFEYCSARKIKFTRYADDMAFSGDFNSEDIISFVAGKLHEISLTLNLSKTKTMFRNSEQIISGVIVNDLIQAPKKVRNQLRQDIYYIKKYGLGEHLVKKNITQANYLSHLLGRINYLLYINPQDTEFIEYKTYLISMLSA